MSAAALRADSVYLPSLTRWECGADVYITSGQCVSAVVNEVGMWGRRVHYVRRQPFSA